MPVFFVVVLKMVTHTANAIAVHGHQNIGLNYTSEQVVELITTEFSCVYLIYFRHFKSSKSTQGC